MEEKDNRKNVNRIKKAILIVIFLLIAFPIILSIFLLNKVSKLEKKIDTIISEQVSPGEAKTFSENIKNYEYLCNMAKGNENADKMEVQNKLEQDTSSQMRLSSPQVRSKEINTSLVKEKASVTDAATMTDAHGTAETARKSDCTVKLNGKKVYLTFDDGPSPYTNEILDILKEKHVKATFFVVASDYSYSDEMNRIVNEGHTIGMHSVTHDFKKIYKNITSYEHDVDGIHDMIYDMTGVDTKFYRFPGGSSNEVSKVSIDKCIEYLNKKGYIYFDWNAANEDATGENLNAEQLNQNVMTYVRENKGDSIVLLHDLETHKVTVDALPGLIDTLRSEGYELLPITDKTIPVQHYVPENNKKSGAAE